MASIRTFPSSDTISPSVRLIEVDFSAYGPAFGISKGAMVGFCSKGPFNVPTMVHNRDELFIMFGYPNPDIGTYLIYSAIEFLRYAEELYIVRVGIVGDDQADYARTAYTEIPSAGMQATIRIPREVPGSPGTMNDYSPISGRDNYLNIKTNTQPLARKFRLPSTDALPLINIADPTVSTVYTVLTAQLRDDDPFEFAQLDGSDGGLLIRSKLNGADAQIELVAVENDIYNDEAGGLYVNIDATRAKVVGTNAQWPLGNSNGPIFDLLDGDLVLSIVVNGMTNSAIDGVKQLILIPRGSYTIDQICTLINDAAYDPLTGYGKVGGFIARPGQMLTVLNGTSGEYEYTTGGDVTEPVGVLVLETWHRGAASRITVKSESTADAYFGLSNIIKYGATTSDADYPSPADRWQAGIYHGSASSANLSFTVKASTPGTEGNNTKVTIFRDVDSGDINIQVFFHDRLMETFSRLNKNETDPTNTRYLERYINGLSRFIWIEDNTLTEEGPLTGTYQLGPIDAMAGTDGIPADTDEQASLIIGDQFLSTGIYSLAEPEKIDIDLAAVPGVSTTSVILALQDLCENARGDCMAIIDCPFGMAPWEVIAWHNGQHPLNDIKLDSSYMALYWPWLKIQDTVNNEYIWEPPSGPVMGQIAYSERVSQAWYAPAGNRRGRLVQVLELETHAYLKERDSMYGYRNAVNPITSFPDTGPVIWGQKTLQRRRTSLDRVNVRRLMLYIKKRIAINAKTYLFEPNDKKLWEQFTRMCEMIMGYIKTNRGVYDYLVECGEAQNPPEVTDRNEMHARIGVQPTKAAEFIYIELTIHRRGTFEQVEQPI